MDQKIQDLFELSKNGTKEERYNALIELNSTLEQPVDWAYDVWDDLIELLSDKDGHQRSRAAQYLSRFAAYSDPEDRILKDFDALWQVTFDEKFVTARHTIQTLWRVGLGIDAAKNLFLEHVIDRFNDGDKEKIIHSFVMTSYKVCAIYMTKRMTKSLKLKHLNLSPLSMTPSIKRNTHKFGNKKRRV